MIILILFGYLYILSSVLAVKSSSTVQIDLRYAFQDISPNSLNDRNYYSMKINGHNIICGDTSIESTFYKQFHNEVISYSPIHLFNSQTQWTFEARMMKYLIRSKLMSLAAITNFYVLNNCLIHFKIDTSLELFCRGHRKDEMANAIIAYYDMTRDRLFNNGTVIQRFKGIDSPVYIDIQFDCDLSKNPYFSHMEAYDDKFILYFKGPSFCNWNTLEINSLYKLLSPLEGWCDIVGSKNYTYEYCYPDSIYSWDSSYESKSKVTNPLQLLGRLISSNKSSSISISNDEYIPVPSSTFPQLRSSYLKRLTPSENIKWENLVVYITNNTFLTQKLATQHLYPLYNVLNQPVHVIVFPLYPGGVCHKINGKLIHYETNIIFHCSILLPTFERTQIISIDEISLCKYHIHIVTPYVCAHPALLNRPESNAQTTICFGDESPLLTTLVKSNSHINQIETILRQSTEANNLNKDHQLVSQLNPFHSLPNYFEFIQNKNEVIYSSLNKEHHDMKYYGLGSYIHKRQNYKDPLYCIGSVVRHKYLNLITIVTGWDYHIKVPPLKLIQYESFYSTHIIRSEPFYRLTLWQNPLDVNSTNYSMSDHLYSPQSSLNPENLEDIKLSKYIIILKEAMKFIYPDENQCNEKLESKT